MLKRLKSRLRRFRRDESGSMIAEMVIMFPTLAAAMVATFVYFDAFRAQSVIMKTAYTLSDALSRETELITNTYLTSLWRLQRFLTDTPTLPGMRVSVVQFDEDNGYLLVWSRNKGGMGDLSQSGLDALVDDNHIPVMPHGEIVLVVETKVDYKPSFSVGLADFTFEHIVTTRPRFAPDQICYSHNGTISGRICPIGS